MRGFALACNPTPGYTRLMTMMDLGPERPGHASDTRQMTEAGRASAHTDANVSGRKFWIAFVVIAAVITVIALVLRA